MPASCRYLQHIELVEPIKRNLRESLVYYRIANHYQFIFRQLFDCFQYPNVLVVEVSWPQVDLFLLSAPATCPNGLSLFWADVGLHAALVSLMSR